MYIDIAMPSALFAITLVTLLLNERVEEKLKGALEKKEISTLEVLVLVAAIGMVVSLVVLIPKMALTIVFLFAYSMLLSIFTYIFSGFQKSKAIFFCMAFLSAAFILAFLSLSIFGTTPWGVYGALAFLGFSAFTLAGLIHEIQRTNTKERWYLAPLPPALFILLYVFFGGTILWSTYLVNLYAIIFAVLITFYLGGLFTWKTSIIFVTLLTFLDIILVLGTGSMISAARHVQGLRLPMLVQLPTVPVITTEGGILTMGLGLGDFFFAGLLAMQTQKKFGKRLAYISIVAMAASFFVFETIMLYYGIDAFPGTVMILSGWLPIFLFQTLVKKK